MIKDIVCWTIIALAIVGVIVFTFALCKSASRFDKISEEQWKEYERKENEKSV